ncbi:MAG: TonB-dependent receptor [Bacteroidetes bacterium]|nr:TonB-dependent receptor [Bacteroidota bacterium]HET6244546.1 TonB-dependent receptor [Bacteroidia bacterium]
MRLFFFAFLIILSESIFAQDKHKISGFIKDGKTGEELIGATVFIEELKTGVVADLDGYYSLTLDEGRYTIKYSYIGYEPQAMALDLMQAETIDVTLGQSSAQLKTVEVSAIRADEHIRSNDMGVIKMNVSDIKTIPVIFGETDILKTLTLMPGVSTAGDGNTGLYVRGGGSDQNLILLDNAPVYNASHLLGFFSVFNSDALSDFKLYKGGIPASYGGRLSSVLDVKQREGNMEKFETSGGLGLISSRLSFEGPLIKDKSSFVFTARRTYADIFLGLSNEERIKNSTLYFYDFNFKANLKISDKDKIFISAYYGKDVFKYNELFGFNWGNTTGTVGWSHIHNEKLIMNTSLIYSNYAYSFDLFVDDTDVNLKSGIKDYNLKVDWDWYKNENNQIKFGLSSIFHDFSLPSFSTTSSEIEDLKVPSRFAIESAAYIHNEQVISPRLSVNYGLRYSLFKLKGPGDVYTFDEAVERVIDTTSYGSDHVYSSYGGLEPRISFTYMLSEKSSVKTAYNRTRQYMHLLSNTSSGSPTDLWIPVSDVLQPQIGNQISSGYFRNFKDNMFETSVEVYYKTMQNIVDYKNGANILFNPTIETELLFGKGWAYGIEFFVRKKVGAVNGWIGYTLSRSMRQIEGINNNNPYPQRYDRTHDLNIMLGYQISTNWNISGTWIYATGNPVTFPVGKYEYEGRVISFYTQRNAYRLEPYHRMDLSATYEPNNSEKKFQSSWNFSLFNVYGRENPYMINFRESETKPGQQEAVRVALFRIVPSVTWNFKF